MIKINLLPPHIHQRKQVKVATGIVVVMLAGEIAGLLAMRQPPLALKAKQQARQQEVRSLLDGVKKVEADAGVVLGEEAALAPKYDFITGTIDYNKAYPDLYLSTASYTYREATLLSLEATTNQLKFDAYVSDSADVARLMIGLSNSPDFTQLPQITGVPDYNSAERKKREAELSDANVPESLIIDGTLTGAGGAGGAGGGYPGMSGGGAMGAPMGGYPGMSGGPMPAGGPGMSAMGGGGEGGYPGMGGMGGAMGGGGGGAKGDISKFRLETAKLKPRGFTVTVTCGLKVPLPQIPTYADSGAQAGSSGGGGGGGGMGGYPGMGGMGGGYPGGGPV